VPKFVAAILACVAVTMPAHADIKIGNAPPNYLGKDGDGNTVDLRDHRGKVVIVSFFASWCGPCRRELPVLANIQEQAGRDKVVVIIVNFKESKKIVSKLREAFADYQVTLTHDRSGSIGSGYGVKGLPRLVVVGKDGKVAAEHVGYGENALPKLVKEINELWNQPIAK
jgi:thiol-disulfide isomerase/thioredoxin